MPYYHFGLILKGRREALGLTQEDLADGICSVPSLSRIENGERRPTKENFEMLLQRLGYSDAVFDEYVDEKTLMQHEMKFKIRHAIINNQLDKARLLLTEYEANSDPDSRIDQQFVELCSVIIYPGKYQDHEEIELLEKALRLTCPHYQEKVLPKLLSYEEIIILNGIACRFMRMKEYDRALPIFFHLKAYYEKSIVNMEEVLRTQLMVLYNLSKCLGLAGKYTACIEICDLAIKIARENGRCRLLSQIFYNRAWSLVKRGDTGDREKAKESAKLALCMAEAIGNQSAAQFAEKFIQNNFPELAHWSIPSSG